MIKNLFFYSRLYPHLITFQNLKKFIFYPVRRITSFPLSINFLITGRCNYRCEMCSFSQNEQASKNELNLQEIENFLSQISKYKPLISLGGGEPLLRKDIYHIIKEVKVRNLKCILLTNGYLLEADKLKGLNLDYLIVSFYGPAEIHNQITGIKDAYQISLQKLREASKKKIAKNIVVSSIILNENIAQLDSFTKKLIELGVKAIKFENLNYLTREELKKEILFRDGFNLIPDVLIREDHFTPLEVNLAWDKISKLKKKYPNQVFLKPELTRKEFFTWYLGRNAPKSNCHFIRHSLFITPQGDVVPCQFIRNSILGNIREDELKYTWTSYRYQKFRELIKESNLKICQRCCK